ncbi:MAG: hypothetical protein L0Y42_10255 [Phycisphaerales bacterium]|nr:hypothetical protein [Phycisphaerales bacterium]
MSEPKKPRLIARLLIAGVLLLACSALALIGLFIANHRRPSGPVNVVLRNSLVGNWVGEHGVTLEFRADGTATSHSKNGGLTSLVWRVSGEELAVYTDTQNRINRYVFNQPDVCEEIAEVTADRLELIDRSRPGKIMHLRFTKKDDAEIVTSSPAKP